MADEPPAAGTSGAGRNVGPTAPIGHAIGRSGVAAEPRACPEDVGLYGRGWHPGVEDGAAMADETPAAGSSGAGSIIDPTTATGRTTGRAGAAAKPPARPEDVGRHGRGGGKDPGGIGSLLVSRPPARNGAPGGGGPRLEDTAESGVVRPAQRRGPDQPSFAAPFSAPRYPTDRLPSVRRCLAIPLESDRGDAGVSPGALHVTLPVARLGRHDASFFYRKQHVVFEQDGRRWQAWLNVLACQVEAPPTELRLLKGQDGRWRTEGEGPTPLWTTGYREFCDAANRSSHPPQQIDIARRWPRRPAAVRTKRAPSPPAARRRGAAAGRPRPVEL